MIACAHWPMRVFLIIAALLLANLICVYFNVLEQVGKWAEWDCRTPSAASEWYA